MSRFRKLHLLVLLVVCASPACEKVPLTSPTGSTISLSTNSNIVPVNGSVDITATVTESAGTAVQNGTTVIFTSDFGRMDPAEAKTQNGRATVRFMASGQSGTVKVNAYSGAASTSGGTTSGALTLLVGGAAAGRMTVRAEPPNIPQAGGTVQVFANVTDTNGNALAGAPVTFTIGGTTGTGVLSTPTVITDANGNAQTALTTSQTTTVTAAVATATATPVTANVIVTALPAPTVAISSSTTTPAVGVAVTFSVTPTIPTGGAPIQNVTVNFGDGNTRNLGNVTGQTAVVNTFSSPGVYTVVATATDATGQTGTGSIAINIQRLLPTVSITLASTATAGSTVSGTVTAAAATGGPALQNVQVTQGGTVIYSGSGGGAFSRQLNSPGSYTFQATATDQAGTQATTTAIVVVAAVAAPTITFTQTSNLTPPAAINTNETFSVSATVATGLTVRSVVVVLVRTGDTLYNQSGGGTFATNNVKEGDLLRATVTDSAGNVSTFDLIVQ